MRNGSLCRLTVIAEAVRWMKTEKRRSEVYHPGPMERLRLNLEAWRLRYFPRRILVAGPYAGEFGYELRFQDWVRALRSRYKKVYVITYPGREILYPGCEVRVHDIRLENAGYGVTGRYSPAVHRSIAGNAMPEIKPYLYDWFTPYHVKTGILDPLVWSGTPVPITAPFTRDDETDLLLHFRGMTKQGWDKRPNFEGRHADALWSACRELGLKCACIGHPVYAYCPPGALDFRSDNLAETVRKICATKLVVGQQSGGVHLANYCGKPTLIWASKPNVIAAGLKLNPLGVPIYVVSDATWLPPVEAIVAELKKRLPTIQTRDACAAPPIPRATR
jgi:hypothetical protein